MAALSSCKFRNLAKRFFSLPDSTARHARPGSRDARRTARLLDPAGLPTGDQIDSLWLARMELRSSTEVAELLVRSGFQERARTVTALFVDSRCGLISSELIGTAGRIGHRTMVKRILGRASACHAHGIILATNDLGGDIAGTAEWHALTTSLSCKGEAMGVSLLNHLVLTADGWKAICPAPWRSLPAAVPGAGIGSPYRRGGLPVGAHGCLHRQTERKSSGIPFAPRQTERD